MFNNFSKKVVFMVLPMAAALMLTGCDDEEAAVSAGAETIDLAQTEDLFTQPIQANPLTSDPSVVVVRVNGEDITRGEILQVVGAALQRMGGQIPPQQLQQVQGQLYQQFKNDLINKKLLDAAIAAAQVSVADEDIFSELNNLRSRVPAGQDLDAALAAQGSNIEELSENIKKDLATRQFLESQLAGVAGATEGEAQEFYGANPDNFAKPEKVAASHILVKFDAEDTEESKAAKKAQLEKVRSDILAEIVNFEDAAKTHSGCPSGATGGSLGTFGKGQMVPAFEVAAFSQEIDEVGDVIETKFGYHIIKVTEHQDEGVVAFEEAKEQLLAYLTSQKKQQAVVDYVQSLRDGATIEEIAQ